MTEYAVPNPPIARSDLEGACPCPCCYRDVRPAPRGTYCDRCTTTGAAARHVAMRRRMDEDAAVRSTSRTTTSTPPPAVRRTVPAATRQRSTPAPQRTGRPAKQERNDAIAEAYTRGDEVRLLATRYRVSEPRIYQILADYPGAREKHRHAVQRRREQKRAYERAHAAITAATARLERAAMAALADGVTAQDAMRVLVRAIATHARDEAAA